MMLDELVSCFRLRPAFPGSPSSPCRPPDAGGAQGITDDYVLVISLPFFTRGSR